MTEGARLIEAANTLASKADQFINSSFQARVKAVADGAQAAGRAWSGSNLGYQANVYYDNLAQPPHGAVFSVETGLGDTFYPETRGDWVECVPDNVKAVIYQRAGNPNLDEAYAAAYDLRRDADALKHEVLSVISIALRAGDDSYLLEQKKLAENSKTLDAQSMAQAQIPSRQVMSRDTRALSGGVRVAPHQIVLGEMLALQIAEGHARVIADTARRVGMHLERLNPVRNSVGTAGTKVFIGHGRSKLWRELKDFVRDRLELPYDEFNSVPVAGISNVMRLSQMLDSAAIALLVLTAEDEQRDGKLQARMNVIHEVGLFQGRLGFSRAIVLLEEGCEEFSNIQGLGQIRFPAGNIAAVFEDVRLVMEREGLVAD